MKKIELGMSEAQYSQATMASVPEETNDSEEVVFERRMSLRKYFRELRAHLYRQHAIRQREAATQSQQQKERVSTAKSTAAPAKAKKGKKVKKKQ